MTILENICQSLPPRVAVNLRRAVAYANLEAGNSSCNCGDCNAARASLIQLEFPMPSHDGRCIFLAEADVTGRSKDEVALALFELAGQVAHADSAVEIGVQFPLLIKGGAAGYFTHKRLVK